MAALRLRLGAVLATLIAAGSLAACGGGGGGAEATGPTRVVKHAMGETKVPETPKRVVVLDTDKLDTMASLGLTPVGAARGDQQTGWPAYLGERFQKVEPVGTLKEPSLEAIKKLRPDLILGSKFRQEALYPKLAAIAPTVFTEKVGLTWKENFLLDADALNKKAEAEKVLAGYHQRAKDLGAKLGDPAKVKVSILRFMPGTIRMYGPQSFSGIVVADTGIGRPEHQLLADAKDKRFAELSAERLKEADGDVLFVSAYGAQAAKDQQAAAAGPLWKTLEAVKSGNAHVVDDDIWMTGIGPTAAGLILDDLQKHVHPAK
ncbi:ABC transporter substrate-binding protein [Bailinhaonella thermotolerans]|uniref:Iron-siderophore ABC transporter substrate-binding protein n=1 Tax=Bailinhaonella thermotolerans TaxID=1070861 RepID=A0A3A4A0W6_9ACTN|nr:iron-siderophore ABC transporter substrate-binding protein [Bailinhaonella thermotolerans]RJL21684.1 iron-siderophore ABC transporter substrate-binding protein [Bailinhaonella thermotolerans]